MARASTRFRAAYGGMAARAARARHLEALLAGRDWAQASEADISAALARDFTPMGDHRGSAAYRLRAAANLVRRLQLESTSHVADPGGGIMNTPLARIRGGVHSAVRHDSAVGHVTGRALYIDDVPNVPGTLEAALVLSPHAHARIRRIDFSRALAAPGVVAAIAAADIPGKNDIGPIRPDEPLLAADLVEYEGQPVAAIAAATLDQARAAAKLVEIEYEPLPAVLTVDEALAREHFVAPPQTIARGDAAAALASAPHRLSGEFRCGGQDHFYLEGQIALATPGDDGTIHLLSSTQHPTEVQHGVAHLLGVPFNAVTAEVRRMGGAFGGKESQATIIAGIAACWPGRRGAR